MNDNFEEKNDTAPKFPLSPDERKRLYERLGLDINYVGHGDYTKEREQLLADDTMEDILREIEKMESK